MPAEMRGDGTLFSQKGSRFLWIQYYVNGERLRESSKSSNPKDAMRLLRTRLAERDSGELAVGIKIPLSQLYENLERDYIINQRKDLINLKCRWANHLKPFFADKAIAQVTAETFSLYIAERQLAGAANASINRELAIMKRMYKLAVKSGRLKIGQQPYIEMLKERNVRKGFVKDEQYEALARETAKIGLWLRAMFEVAYTYGWRKSELLNLKVGQVDLNERTIVLNPGETKNDAGRGAPMTGKVFSLLSALVSGKGPEDYIFTRDTKRGKAQHISTFRKAWEEATRLAGVPDLLFHDLRRSGVRNMRRNGISEKVAMTISGHRTRSVFERYNIVDPSDLAAAGAKLEMAARERDRHAQFVQQDINFQSEGKPN